MIEIVSRVLGLEEAKEVFDSMPPLFRKTARHWIFSERKRFHKQFQRTIKSQRRNAGAPSMFKRGGKWEEKVAGPFHNIEMLDKDNEISAETGLQESGNKPMSAGFKRRLMLMEGSTGDSTMTSSGKYMLIPMVKNLYRIGAGRRSDFGSGEEFGGTSRFSHWYNNAQARVREGFGTSGFNPFNKRGGMVPFKRGNTMYWFNPKDKGKRGKLNKSAILFIGKKMVKLRKRFDYIRAYEGRKDMAVENFVNKVNRLLRNVSRGYLSDA